jgi:hypothetical protein
MKIQHASVAVMWLGIALFPAGVWWAQGARESAGLPFESSDWRVWFGFAAFVIVFTVAALLRWRNRKKTT